MLGAWLYAIGPVLIINFIFAKKTIFVKMVHTVPVASTVGKRQVIEKTRSIISSRKLKDVQFCFKNHNFV